MKKFLLMSPEQIIPYQQYMEEYKVSEVARSKGGFLYNYLKYGKKMLSWKAIGPDGKLQNITWEEKRNNFISRHLVQYKKKKSLRRFLALIAWAYHP